MPARPADILSAAILQRSDTPLSPQTKGLCSGSEWQVKKIRE